MADVREHAATVLSAILPARKDLLDKALLRLTPEHFPDRVQATLFKFLERYADHTGSVLPLKHLDDLVRGKSAPGQAELLIETYTTYAQTPVDDAEFNWSVEQLREIAAEKATGAALTEAMEILRTGREDETGEVQRGHEAARSALTAALAHIDREITAQEAPEGALKHEHAEILADYAERKKAQQSGALRGIEFGVAPLDAKVGGMQNGEVWLIAGYSSDGKTTLASQAAWSAAIEQGKNVVFLTTETLRDQVRRKLVARHSKMEQFGLTHGLNTRDLKSGTLPDEQEQSLTEVVADLTTNPAYGTLYIAQVPRGATISHIEQRLYRIQRQFHIEFVVMDYLALLSADRKRQTQREELAHIMKEAKNVATTFDGGRGIPLCSPWQVSRAARENAEKIGMYTTAALSETAEATNTADGIVGLLAPTDNTSRFAEVTAQVMKHRDGETANGIVLSVDYATSWFGGRSGMQFAPIPTAAGQTASLGFGGLDDLMN